MATYEGKPVTDRSGADKGGGDKENPWPKRLDAFREFSRKFHERGTKIEARYEDDREALGTDDPSILAASYKRVNLFYSNVCILKESLYNSLPKPDVSRLHKGDFENEPARVAALIVERGLTYEVHCAKWFDEGIKSAILDRLVPGMGTVWLTFIPATADRPEEVTIDFVHWKDLVYEPRRKWEECGYVGRKLHLDHHDAVKKWGEQAGELPVEKNKNYITAPDNIDKGKVCIIQMWEKKTGMVYHMTENGTILDKTKDPYRLNNFYPCPKPLIAAPPTSKFLPMADYYMAQDQYTQLDTLYARISLIIEAVRVAGVYDASQPEIGRMLSGSENKLIPVDNWAMFADKGGAKGTIDWFPVEQIVGVLQQLVTTYEFMKNQLFEVTGMADIIRGSSNQYETLGAQQIKAQFASVRMTALQRDVAFFVRDVIRIIAEMMCQLYSEQKLSAICGQLPQDDQPHVPQALELLRNDFQTKYSIDIEADSLTQADWALEQQQRMALTQTISQFLTSAVPAIEANPALAPLLMQILKFSLVGFKGSAELEGALDQAMNQLKEAGGMPEKPDPEAQKAQMEMQKMQGEMAMKQQDAQLKMQEGQQNLQMKREEMAMKREEHMMDMQMKREAHELDMQFEREKFTMKTQQEAIHGAMEMRQNDERFQHEREQDEVRLESEIIQGAQKSQAEIQNSRNKQAAKPKPAKKE
jgi:hypothetical protein